MIELRAATSGDADAIATIWHGGWFDGHLGHVPESLYEHRRFADFERRVPVRLASTTVAVDGATVVGFVVVHGDEVEQLYVAPAARGGTAAGSLLRLAETQIATARHERAWLAVAAGNERARRFYTRNGWRDAGAFEYAAEAGTGTVSVPVQRYEKVVR